MRNTQITTQTLFTNDNTSITLTSITPTNKIKINITTSTPGNLIYTITDTYNNTLIIDTSLDIRFQDLINTINSNQSTPFITLSQNTISITLTSHRPFSGHLIINLSQLNDFTSALNNVEPLLNKYL